MRVSTELVCTSAWVPEGLWGSGEIFDKKGGWISLTIHPLTNVDEKNIPGTAGFLRRCLTLDPKQRPSEQDLLKDCNFFEPFGNTICFQMRPPVLHAMPYALLKYASQSNMKLSRIAQWIANCFFPTQKHSDLQGFKLSVDHLDSFTPERLLI